MTTVTVTKAPERRVRRTPINGTRSRLAVKDKDPNYFYRIVNDVDDRVAVLQDAGYEIVKDAQVGEKRVNTPTPLGSTTVISVGGGVKAVLMRQKKEWYQEDQATKQAELDRLEESTKNPAVEGSYGTIKLSRS